MAVPTGKFDCKFWLHEGLSGDIQAVKPLHNKRLLSSVRRKEADWSVNVYQMPDDSLPHTTSYSEVR
jgi:hypothetical protein